MGRRSLLGGSKRQQRQRDQHEAESSWQRRQNLRASEAEQEETDLTAEEDAGSTVSGPGTGAELELEDEEKLSWHPALPDTETDPVASTAPDTQAKPDVTEPIPWHLDLEDPSQDFGREAEPGPETVSLPAGPPAPVPPQTREAPDDSLLAVTKRQARTRRLRRRGWIILSLTLALTLVLALL